jgi:hypothetical protein
MVKISGQARFVAFSPLYQQVPLGDDHPSVGLLQCFKHLLYPIRDFYRSIQLISSYLYDARDDFDR